MKDKRLYQDFVERTNAPVFFNTWWLDAVCGESNWEFVSSTKGGEIVAVWPYQRVTKKGLKLIQNPVLTPRLGVWFNHPESERMYNRLSFEKDTVKELIESLGEFHGLNVNFHEGFTYWSPFLWAGYSQTTQYSFVLSDMQSEEEVFRRFRDTLRRRIKKGSKALDIQQSKDIQRFTELNAQIFERQEVEVPYSNETFTTLVENALKHDKGILLSALHEGRVVGGVFLVWDARKMYYIAAGSEPETRNLGVTSVLLWEGIKIAIERGLDFDFEGSMIERLERTMRNFGGVPIPYSKIFRDNSKLLKLKRVLK